MTGTAKPEFNKNSDFKGTQAEYEAAVWGWAEHFQGACGKAGEPGGDELRAPVQGQGLRSEHVLQAFRYLRDNKPA